MKLLNKFILTALVLMLPALLWAAEEEIPQNELAVIEDSSKAIPETPAGTTAPEEPLKLAKAETPIDNSSYMDPVKYTLGAEDIVDITVMRHPEFSGIYPVNSEGKIQYKFVGDIDITGLTKKELEKKIAEIISVYVINPEVNVTITEYKSKVIYILGEVGQPGKFYMQSETIPVREAVVRAGLPTLSAAMRKCRIITPSNNGKAKIKSVDLYAILYGGDLKRNIDMHPGDVLYVPSTVMAKVIRVINPIASTVGLASSTPDSVNTGKTAIKTLAK